MPNTFGGNSSTNRELAFSIKFSVVDHPETLTDFTRFFKSAKAEVSDMSSYHVIVELFDGEGSELETSLVMAGQNSLLRLSFGWREDDNPTLILKVVSFTPQFLPNGFGISIACVPENAYQSGLNKLPANTFSFPGGTYSASAMVREIAAREITVPDSNNLVQATVIKTIWKNPIIENSEGIIKADISTPLGSTACGFILEKRMPLAINDAGNPFDFYFDDSGRMHFHSKGYDVRTGSSTDSANSEPIAASYEYARDPAGDVISFEPNYAQVGAAMLGGSRAVYKGVNARDGSTTSVTTTTVNNGVNASNIALPTDSKHIMDVGAGVNSYTKLPDRDPSDLHLRSQSVYGYLRNTYVTASLVVTGNWSLRIGQLVNIVYKRRDGSSHPMGGLFRIMGVAHTIDSSRGFVSGCNIAKAGIGDSAPGLVNIVDSLNITADVTKAATNDDLILKKTVN
jgi:hypothetical protein